MSKAITLSNLERFHSNLNLSSSGGYIKAIKTNNHTTGNISIDTSNRRLEYTLDGRWGTISKIQLYSGKPRENNVAVRINASEVRYAGLCDPSEPNASDIRIKLGNRIYAIERESYTYWEGNASVVDGKIEISPRNYIYCGYLITLGGSDDVEVYVKKYYRDTVHLGAGNYAEMFSMVRAGKSASAARDTTTGAVIWQDLAVWGESSYDTTGIVAWRTQANMMSSNKMVSVYGGFNIVQAKDIKVERDYKWIYDASIERLDFISEAANYDTRTSETTGRILYGQYPTYRSDTLQTVYIAMGDMRSTGYGTMVITDFYVKINGTTVLSFSDLLEQFE